MGPSNTYEQEQGLQGLQTSKKGPCCASGSMPELTIGERNVMSRFLKPAPSKNAESRSHSILTTRPMARTTSDGSQQLEGEETVSGSAFVSHTSDALNTESLLPVCRIALGTTGKVLDNHHHQDFTASMATVHDQGRSPSSASHLPYKSTQIYFSCKRGHMPNPTDHMTRWTSEADFTHRQLLWSALAHNQEMAHINPSTLPFPPLPFNNSQELALNHRLLEDLPSTPRRTSTAFGWCAQRLLEFNIN